MATREVPEGLAPKPVPVLSDELFGFKGIDGEPIVFTLAQLFNALTKEILIGKLGLTALSGSNTGDQNLSNLVVKVSGKQLSSNDYTTEEKVKLAGLTQGSGGAGLPTDFFIIQNGVQAINPLYLPNGVLSPNQFKEVTNSSGVTEIQLIGFENIGSGTAPLPQLAATQVSFGTSTTTQNVINLSVVPNATTYVIKNGAGVTLYSGSLRSYTHTGLTPNTDYTYSAYATAPNYRDGTPVSATKRTLEDTGTVPDGMTNVTSPVLEGMTFNATTATLTRVDSPSGLKYARFAERIAYGAEGTYQAFEDEETGGIILALHNQNNYSANPVIRLSRNFTNKKLEMQVLGEYYTILQSVNGRIGMRLVLSNSTVTPWYSTNNGALWISGTPQALPPNTTVFYAQATEGDEPAQLQNIQHKGFTTS